MGERAVDYDKPIAVFLMVNSAKDVSPGKFALAKEFGGNDPVVKGAAFGILGCVPFVKCVYMAEENTGHALFIARDDFNGKRAER